VCVGGGGRVGAVLVEVLVELAPLNGAEAGTRRRCHVEPSY